MLTGPISLKLKAGLLFAPIFVLTFIAGLLFVSSASLSFEEDHHTAPRMAIAFALDDLSVDNDRLVIDMAGPFGELARANPALWLIIKDGPQRQVIGNPPAAAVAAVDRLEPVSEDGDFHVPGVARPLSDASFASAAIGARPLFVAAGGIDARHVSMLHAIRYFLDQGLFVAFLVLGLAGLALAIVSLPLLTSAVSAIGRQAAALKPGDDRLRLDTRHIPSELTPLVVGFNQLLDRLDLELERRRQLIAAVAHEIRTPIAILELQADRLEDDENRTAIQRTIERVTSLLGQMLDVERMGAKGGDIEAIDLVSLARDVVTEMAPLGFASGYELVFEHEIETTWINGDRSAVQRAIANLVGNAISHGGARGTILVQVSDLRVDVIDEGPGVPENARPDIFQPFIRGSTNSPGSGLGLHLTEAIMHAHGGTVRLEPSAIGAHFRLDFASVGHVEGPRSK